MFTECGLFFGMGSILFLLKKLKSENSLPFPYCWVFAMLLYFDVIMQHRWEDYLKWELHRMPSSSPDRAGTLCTKALSLPQRSVSAHGPMLPVIPLCLSHFMSILSYWLKAKCLYKKMRTSYKNVQLLHQWYIIRSPWAKSGKWQGARRGSNPTTEVPARPQMCSNTRNAPLYNWLVQGFCDWPLATCHFTKVAPT